MGQFLEWGGLCQRRTMAENQKKAFGFLRSIFWPVHREEVARVVCMLLLLFLLCTSYSVLRNLKDTVILTADASGAEVIPFIKVWGMLPGALIATWCYTRLTRWFGRERVFYIMLSGFLGYFLLFAFVIHPNSEQLHLTRLGDWLTQVLPAGFKGLIALIRNWSFTTFYVITELWSIVVLFLLFWGFANEISGLNQAKRTYGLLNTWSNLSPIVGGGLALLFSSQLASSGLTDQHEAWSQTLKQLTCLVTALGVSGMAVFYWLTKKILPRAQVDSAASGGEKEPVRKANAKVRLSMRESIRYLSRSKYLLCLALIVLGYNISINLTDVLWKEQLKRFFTDPNEMLAHMNQITIGIGIFATTCGLMFSFMVHRWGWTFPAILSPMVMLTMAVGFFAFHFGGEGALGALATGMFGVTPLALTVYFGSLQNCLSKATKYSVFDASKELAFIPLDPDARLKGKAAIDGLGAGIGKSGASLTYQGLIIVMGSVALSTPYIAIILAIALTGWIYSVVYVGKRFREMNTPQEKTAPSESLPQES